MADKKVHQDDDMQNVEQALNKTEAFIEKNQKTLLIIVSIVVLVVVAVIGFNNWYLQPRESEAADQMAMAELYFEKDSFNLALNGDGINEGFLDIIDNYGITESADLARYYAGVSYYHLGQYENAIDYLKKADLESFNLSVTSVGLIGDCYVQLGQVEKSLSYFEEAGKSDNEVLAPIYLEKAAIAYESLGNYKKAIEAYTRIKDVFFMSQQAANAEKAIIRCEYLNK